MRKPKTAQLLLKFTGFKLCFSWGPWGLFVSGLHECEAQNETCDFRHHWTRTGTLVELSLRTAAVSAQPRPGDCSYMDRCAGSGADLSLIPLLTG